MIELRKASDRGRTTTDWLDSAHSFAFGGYRDPAWTGYRNLRVINDDRIAPGGGFGPHGHAEMEILTVVLEGALAHRDSAGHHGVVRAGDVQRMSAGTGIVHSEVNASEDDPVRLIQIWIHPDRAGLAPGYAQRSFPAQGPGLWLVADPDGRDGALRLHADARLHLARLAAGERLTLPFAAGRHGWLQLVGGEVALAGERLRDGDGAALAPLRSGFERPTLEALEPSALLWFELA